MVTSWSDLFSIIVILHNHNCWHSSIHLPAEIESGYFIIRSRGLQQVAIQINYIRKTQSQNQNHCSWNSTKVCMFQLHKVALLVQQEDLKYSLVFTTIFRRTAWRHYSHNPVKWTKMKFKSTAKRANILSLFHIAVLYKYLTVHTQI